MRQVLVQLGLVIVAALLIDFVADAANKFVLAQYTITPPSGANIIDQGLDAQGRLQFMLSTGVVTLAPRNYTIFSGVTAIDAGFGCQKGNPTGVGPTATTGPVNLLPINGSDAQIWIWNGSSLQNIGLSLGAVFCGVVPVATGSFLAEGNAGTVITALSGDTMKILAAGSQYTIQDLTTNHFLDATGGILKFDSTQFLWSTK